MWKWSQIFWTFKALSCSSSYIWTVFCFCFGVFLGHFSWFCNREKLPPSFTFWIWFCLHYYNDVCVGLFEVELENCSSRYPMRHFMFHLDVGELHCTHDFVFILTCNFRFHTILLGEDLSCDERDWAMRFFAFK